MKSNGLIILAAVILAAPRLSAQPQASYTGADATGELVLTRTVNLRQAQNTQSITTVAFPETVPVSPKRLHPPVSSSSSILALPPVQILNVVAGPAALQFNGLTHMDQRTANAGNQFSVEPPNPSIAVGNGFVLQGVNNAVQVYDTFGNPLLSRVLSTNEVFGVPAAINRTTGANGVFPTDMRVFFDPPTNQWFILQRAQDNDIFGNSVNSSHLYLAVSQTSDPTGTYNIYIKDTTNALHPGCPCLADYPQIGADQYGFYISANEYNTSTESYIDAIVLAISKGSLASGASTPTAFKVFVPFTFGYEFTIQPATTPPGASYFLGNAGVEYFASTIASFSTGASTAIWAMTNTSSLATGHPNPTLTRIIVPTLAYAFPNVANQPDGSRPYGLSLTPQGPLPFIDGGDSRILSLSYSGGRLYATLATSASDASGRSVVGGIYAVFSPTLRSGVLTAPVLRQNYLVLNNAHLLRPSIAVDPQGRGAITATVVGPGWYPSAAFIPVDTFSTPSTVQIAGAGVLPEDGFTGYTPGSSFPTIARWGDYASAVVAGDGSVWMVTEYIANLPRTTLANWDTFIMSVKP